MAEVVFVQPYTVGAALAQRLGTRVVVLDVAFCADTPRSTFATTTLPFIQTLGERLVLWVDHHDHERHADFANDPRFLLRSRKEHPAVPEMITPALVQRVGPVDTIVAHGDFDGVMAAAKWLLGGEEPYTGADADARAADSRIGTLSPLGQMIDEALKVNPSDDAFRHTLLHYLVSRCQDKAAEAEIQQRAAAYRAIAERTAFWAQRYQVVGSLAIVDIRSETERVDLTALLLAGQELAPIAVVRNRHLQTGEPQVTIAAATDSGYDFVRLFGLKGGMPTRVTLPDERFEEAVARLQALLGEGTGATTHQSETEAPSQGQATSQKWLLLADVDRIKDYLFASVRLKQMVGASALLAYVNEDRTRAIIRRFRGTVIFSQGGVTQAVFDDRGAAKEAQKELERVYPEETGGATVTVVVCEVKGNFAQSLREGLRELAQKKMTSGLDDETAPSLVASPFFRFCAQTGWQYAEFWEQRIESREPEEEEQAGEEREDQAPEEFSQASWRQHQWRKPLSIDGQIRRVIAEKLKCRPGALRFPRDFDDLAKQASPNGYMAFIEADGNRFGELLNQLAANNGTEEDYRTFSQALSLLTRTALLLAIRETVPRWVSGGLIPLRVLILGGDDVLLVTVPQVALALVERFCRQFQWLGEQFKQGKLSGETTQLPQEVVRDWGQLKPTKILQGLRHPFTMSAGVVIAHHNLPFLSFRRLGEQLLKSAKRRSWAASRKGVHAGSVEFQIITGSGVDELTALRREGYQRSDKPERWLTGRPYLAAPEEEHNEFGKLLKAVGTLKEREFARHQIHALERILRELPYERGMIAFWRWWHRLGEKQRDALGALLQEFSGDGELLSPWRGDQPYGGRRKPWTPLLDAVELLQLLGG